jgi:cytochrome P450
MKRGAMTLDYTVIDGIDIRGAMERMQQTGTTDIYEPYEAVRAQAGAIYRGDIIADHFGGYSAASMVERPVISVLGIAEALEVYRDSQTFSSSIMMESVGKSMGRNLLMVDPPEHTRLRKAVQGIFGKRQMEELGSAHAAQAVDLALAQIGAQGHANLFDEFIQWLPANVVFGMLGLPPQQRDQFRLYSTALNLMASDVPHVAISCSQWLAQTLGGFIEGHGERVTQGSNSGLIDQIIEAQNHEDGLTGEEILNFLRVLLPAGSETTIAGLATMFAALLCHPDQLDLIREDPALVPGAIEESLRWQAPNQFTYRLTQCDTKLGDFHVAAGTAVIICEGAANRDPGRWEHADRFDVTRKIQTNVAFGGGAHHCLGAHLARVEMRTALEHALQQLPGLRLDPGKPPPQFVGLLFRSIDSLHACWD